MSELIWKIGLDEKSVKRAGKDFAKESSKQPSKGGGGGAFAGGFIGAILGDLLSSVKALFDPLSAIANLLVLALFPLFKPFLILFIKVGILLYKWLQSATAGVGAGEGGGVTDIGNGILKAGEGLKSALFILGAVITGIIASILGAPALLVAALAVLGGIIVSKVGGVIADKLLFVAQWLDNIFGSNLITPLINIFNGISDTFNGLWNIIVSLLDLDFKGAWEGFVQFSRGIVGIIIGLFGTLWENLKLAFTVALSGFRSVLNYIVDWFKNLVKKAISSVKSFFSFGGSSSVNDAIITPQGNVIRTNPNDYLIATKNPSSLGGGMSGSATVNVNINGGLITEEVARDIGRIIQRQINYGGGF